MDDINLMPWIMGHFTQQEKGFRSSYFDGCLVPTSLVYPRKVDVFQTQWTGLLQQAAPPSYLFKRHYIYSYSYIIIIFVYYIYSSLA